MTLSAHLMLRVLRSGIAAGVNAEAAAMHTASESAFVAILQGVSSHSSETVLLSLPKEKKIHDNRSRKWRRTRRKRKNRAGARG